MKVLEIHKIEEEVTKAEFELSNVLEKHDRELKEKLIEYITHSYFNAMMEVDRRKLVERAKTERPRIDHYLKSMFFYIFNKLHKGNKLKAYEILEEIKSKVINL